MSFPSVIVIHRDEMMFSTRHWCASLKTEQYTAGQMCIYPIDGKFNSFAAITREMAEELSQICRLMHFVIAGCMYQRPLSEILPEVMINLYIRQLADRTLYIDLIPRYSHVITIGKTTTLSDPLYGKAFSFLSYPNYSKNLEISTAIFSAISRAIPFATRLNKDLLRREMSRDFGPVPETFRGKKNGLIIFILNSGTEYAFNYDLRSNGSPYENLRVFIEQYGKRRPNLAYSKDIEMYERLQCVAKFQKTVCAYINMDIDGINVSRRTIGRTELPKVKIEDLCPQYMVLMNDSAKEKNTHVHGHIATFQPHQHFAMEPYEFNKKPFQYRKATPSVSFLIGLAERIKKDVVEPLSGKIVWIRKE